MVGVKGFSLRQHLIDSSVTTEEATRAHLAHVYSITKQLPRVSVTRYRVNPMNPNKVWPSQTGKEKQ
jgi:hypothetical protein